MLKTVVSKSIAWSRQFSRQYQHVQEDEWRCSAPSYEYSAADLLLKPWVCRPLFCSFDYAMLQKNVRNQLLKWNLHIQGKSVTGDFSVRLFEEQTGELLTAVRSWTSKHVMPNNIENRK
jgi:hypothetical protein